MVSVQSLYTMKLWKFCKTLFKKQARAMQWFLVLLLSITFGTRIASTWATFHTATILQVANVQWALYSASATATVVDLTISAVLGFSLWQHQTGFQRTDSLIRTVSPTAMRTGALTFATSLSEIVTFLVLPSTLIPFGVNAFRVKLYVNSYMSSLNARPPHMDSMEARVSQPQHLRP
ncbi:hypothetical protein OE88DRAFT_1668370 [Heliocybe sulcata]|uniref:DUF6534 domain-containing protein n=1 Tax=Heliocybe sulcata TaxID=5364 RepID=A0A5C3MPK9_9AGAM|nr:hypothetical protein OE88DRAFT_1668370 [Heliocybe sulcata]